jgi:hypothetical protein
MGPASSSASLPLLWAVAVGFDGLGGDVVKHLEGSQDFLWNVLSPGFMDGLGKFPGVVALLLVQRVDLALDTAASSYVCSSSAANVSLIFSAISSENPERLPERPRLLCLESPDATSSSISFTL